MITPITIFLLMISSIVSAIALAISWKVQKWFGNFNPFIWFVVVFAIILMRRIITLLGATNDVYDPFDEFEAWFGPILAPTLTSILTATGVVHLYWELRKFVNGHGSLLKNGTHKDKK